MVFNQRFRHYVNLHLPIQWKYGVMQKKINDFKQWLKTIQNFLTELLIQSQFHLVI